MSFTYEDRQVWVGALDGPMEPGAGYTMCGEHADRLTPPVGWTLTDRRAVVRPLVLELEVA